MKGGHVDVLCQGDRQGQLGYVQVGHGVLVYGIQVGWGAHLICVTSYLWNILKIVKYYFQCDKSNYQTSLIPPLAKEPYRSLTTINKMRRTATSTSGSINIV